MDLTWLIFNPIYVLFLIISFILNLIIFRRFKMIQLFNAEMKASYGRRKDDKSKNNILSRWILEFTRYPTGIKMCIYFASIILSVILILITSKITTSYYTEAKELVKNEKTKSYSLASMIDDKEIYLHKIVAEEFHSGNNIDKYTYVTYHLLYDEDIHEIENDKNVGIDIIIDQSIKEPHVEVTRSISFYAIPRNWLTTLLISDKYKGKIDYVDETYYVVYLRSYDEILTTNLVPKVPPKDKLSGNLETNLLNVAYNYNLKYMNILKP